MRVPGWILKQRRMMQTRRGGVSDTVRSEATASLRSGMRKVADEVRNEEKDTAPLSDRAYAAKKWLVRMLG